MEDEPVAKRKRKGVGEGTGEEGERMDLGSLPAAVAAVSKQQAATPASAPDPDREQPKQSSTPAANPATKKKMGGARTTTLRKIAPKPAEMPSRHSWELDWTSRELTLERQKNQRLEQENEQLRAKLEQVSQLHQPQAFAAVPSALPVLAPQMQQQKALDAFIKASQQQALQQIALQQLLQHQQSQPSALAGANLQQHQLSQLLQQVQGKTPIAQVQPQMPQQHPAGATTYEDLKKLCDQASVSSGVDMGKVEKLLLALQQAEAPAKKQWLRRGRGCARKCAA